MTNDRFRGGALLSFVFAMAVLAALLIFVEGAAAGNDASSPARPKLTSFKILQPTVTDNDKNDVKLGFAWNVAARNLQGGVLKLSVTDANGISYPVVVDLTRKKYAKASGKAKAKVRLVCSDSEWLAVTAWLEDSNGRKSNRKKVTLPSVPNPNDNGSYKISWPLGTEAYRRALNFTGFDQDGKKVSLWDFYGKIIFVEFGTMWCGPCDWMSGDVERLWKKWKGNDNVVFVSVFHEGYTNGVPVTQADLKTWAADHKYQVILLADPEREAMGLFHDPAKPATVPQYMFIDPFMQISFKGVGWGQNFFYDQINNSIKTMVNRWFSGS